jgi:O-antigen/teichoic acid export membrane protein
MVSLKTPNLPARTEAIDDAGQSVGFAVTRGTIRNWGMKSALSLVDQALTSIAGFGVNILLARWMTADQYGAFALAFAGYLFLAGFHNVLLLEPLSVIGPARHSGRLRDYFHAQIGVHGMLVLPLAAITLMAAGIVWRVNPYSPLIGALAGGGMALPFLLFLWLARRMCYVLQQPALAAWGSGLYLVASLGPLLGLRLLHLVTPLTAFASAAFGSTAGAVAIMRRIRLGKVKASDEACFSRRKVLAENWIYGRWLVGSAVLYAVSTYSQMFFVAGAIGLSAAGILRAVQIPSLVMTQIITAIGLLILPSFSFDFGRSHIMALRRNATLVSIVIGTSAAGFALMLAIADKPVEHLLFGDKYLQYSWLIPVLALVPVFNGLAMGYSMALRASQRSYFDLVSNAFAAPIAVISTLLFTRWWGLAGSAASIVLSFAVFSVVTVIFFRRLLRDPLSPATKGALAFADGPGYSRVEFE